MELWEEVEAIRRLGVKRRLRSQRVAQLRVSVKRSLRGRGAWVASDATTAQLAETSRLVRERAE